MFCSETVLLCFLVWVVAHYVAQADLEVFILLIQPLKSWDHSPSFLVTER